MTVEEILEKRKTYVYTGNDLWIASLFGAINVLADEVEKLRKQNSDMVKAVDDYALRCQVRRHHRLQMKGGLDMAKKVSLRRLLAHKARKGKTVEQVLLALRIQNLNSGESQY